MASPAQTPRTPEALAGTGTGTEHSDLDNDICCCCRRRALEEDPNAGMSSEESNELPMRFQTLVERCTNFDSTWTRIDLDAIRLP
jgi:hypothetical protein